ncbi:hypothetical protein AAEP80_00805 [Curtobacterium sp. L3-7]|uniref:hypothetical protein n=1 Tax=Curtobacterium sp. L3-7 TaxID=3138787 RepID=UPI003B52D47A
MGEQLVTAPVMSVEGRRFRIRGWMVAAVAVVAVFVFRAVSVWSASADYGGVDADGHWIDAQGAVVPRAPPSVSVVGHASPLVLVLIVLAGVVGVTLPATLSRYGRDRAGRIVRVVALVAIPVLVVVGVGVYSFWQSAFVLDQVQRQTLPVTSFPWGGATVTVEHMTR